MRWLEDGIGPMLGTDDDRRYARRGPSTPLSAANEEEERVADTKRVFRHSTAVVESPADS